jgi:hypothetical protein
VEDYQGTPAMADLMHIGDIPILVRQYDIGEVFPNGGAYRAEVDTKVRDRCHRLSLASEVRCWSLSAQLKTLTIAHRRHMPIP